MAAVPRPLRLCFDEILEETCGILYLEREDLDTPGGPLNIFIDGSTSEDLLKEENYGFFGIELRRVADRDAAHIRIRVEPTLLYDIDTCYGESGEVNILEYLRVTSVEIRDDMREALLRHIMETCCSPTVFSSGKVRPAPYQIPESVEAMFSDTLLLNTAFWEKSSISLFLRDLFLTYLRDEGITRPTKSLLRFHKDILIKRYLFREPDLTAREWEAIYAGVLESMKLEHSNSREERETTTTPPQEFSADWQGLRELALSLCREKGLSERDSIICSRFIVPDYIQQERTDLRKTLLEEGTDIGISQAGFNDVIRRQVSKRDATLTPTDLGRLGESFTHSLLSPLVDCSIGPEAFGVCDISDARSGLATDATWAINVKLSLEDDVNRPLQLSPEHLVSPSWALLVMPRLLEMRLYPIESEYQTLSSVSGGLCVAPAELADTVQKLLSGEIRL